MCEDQNNSFKTTHKEEAEAVEMTKDITLATYQYSFSKGRRQKTNNNKKGVGLTD